MKNLIQTCALLSLTALTGAQDTQVPTIELAQDPSSSDSSLVLPAFNGIAKVRDAKDVTVRILELSGSRENTRSLSLFPLAGSDKLRFEGRFDRSIVMQFTPSTGDISFQADAAGMDELADTPGLPFGQNAVQTALQHLALLELMPENPSELVVRHIGGVRLAQVEDGVPTREFNKVTSVHFGRRIGGVEVSGPGSKMIVQLGENGRLVGLTRRWSELEMVASSKRDMVPAGAVPAQVSLDLQKTHDKAMKINASQPRLGFFDDGKGRIEPAWFTTAKVSYDPLVHEFAQSGEAINALSVISALRKSTADFVQQDRAQEAPTEAPEEAGGSADAQGTDD